MKIESIDIDLENLLNSRYFSVPRFQRPYSWEEENINDLWNDVTTNSSDYFIGSMVVFTMRKQEHGIVDGQQRLTTLTIMLCTIRDAFDQIGSSNLAQGLHQLIERKDRSNEDTFVLRTETSFPYFQERIQRFGVPQLKNIVEMSEEKNLKQAHELIGRKVRAGLLGFDSDASLDDPARAAAKEKYLLMLRDAVLNLKLILVTLENEDDAYLIFETLNTRGKDLSVTDLVKNHFTKLLKSPGAVDAAKITWGLVLEAIYNSSADITSDNFLYHYWASRYEAQPLKKLYPAIKKQIIQSNAKQALEDLVENAEYYRSIYEPSFGWFKNEAKVMRSLEAIQLFKLSQPMPAILCLVRNYKCKKIKLAKLTEALSAIEKFHFAFTAVTSSRSSGGISGMYSAFARRLEAAPDSNSAADEVSDLVAKLRLRRPSADEFQVGFSQLGFTNTNSKNSKLIRYVLRNIAEHQGYLFSVDFADLTIEHIAPQSSTSEPGWSEELIGQLGNLMFLDPTSNVQAGNHSFAQKSKLVYSKIGGSIPTEVSDAKAWTPLQVIDRTKSLATLAYETVWAI